MQSKKKSAGLRGLKTGKASDSVGGLKSATNTVTQIEKPNKTITAARIIKTAEVVAKTPRQVQRVLKGEQKNDKVIEVFMRIEEGENILLDAIKKLVPFN